MQYQNDLPERERRQQIAEARRLSAQDRHIEVSGNKSKSNTSFERNVNTRRALALLLPH